MERMGVLMANGKSLLLVAVAALAWAGCSNPEAARYCEANLTVCGGGCFDLSSDPDNCGTCGNPCAVGQFCDGGTCAAHCQNIAGPPLANTISGWPDSGLQITALRDTILTGFTFWNQGVADTITLSQAGTPLFTVGVPAGVNGFSPYVSWPLQAGVTYLLTNANGTNGRWENYTAWPTSSGALQVDGTWGSGALQSSYWFSFTNLTTCP